MKTAKVTEETLQLLNYIEAKEKYEKVERRINDLDQWILQSVSCLHGSMFSDALHRGIFSRINPDHVKRKKELNKEIKKVRKRISELKRYQKKIYKRYIEPMKISGVPEIPEEKEDENNKTK